jgi:hypothetical protein
VRFARRLEAAKEIGVARQPAHGRFRHATAPLARGVSGPRPDESSPYGSFAPHTSRKRQIRSAPLAGTCGSLGDAVADAIDVQCGNRLGPGRRHSAQQENCRTNTYQDCINTHCPPHTLARPTAVNHGRIIAPPFVNHKAAPSARRFICATSWPAACGEKDVEQRDCGQERQRHVRSAVLKRQGAEIGR